MKKYLYWFGILATIFYILGVIIGGALIPNYSHVNQAISEIDPLISDNYRIITTVLFGAYNLFTFIFGIVLFVQNKNLKFSFRLQALTLSLIGLAGLLLYFFPMDIVGSAATLKGTLHIVFVGVIAPLTILTTALGISTFKDNKKMRIYSTISCAIITVSGGFTAYYAANGMHSGFGILERTTIGTFILWIAVIAIYYNKRIKIED